MDEPQHPKDTVQADSQHQGSVRPIPSGETNGLRQGLARSLKLMTLVMFGGFLYWCFSGLGADKQTQVKSYQLDVSDVGEGEFKHFTLGSQPLIAVHRSPAQIASLSDDTVNDPNSWQNNEPNGIDKTHRGVTADWIVVEALGTALNCPIKPLPAGGEFQGRPWLGGFVDQCRGYRYDWAGRVFKKQAATRNLRVMYARGFEGKRLSVRLR